MIETIKSLFRGKRTIEYAGLSDFLLRASPDEKKKVIAEAAHKANEDQLKMFNKARLKIRMN